LSLSNLNIAVTASRRAGKLAKAIRSLGGRSHIDPTTGIRRVECLFPAVSKFIELAKEGRPDFVVFVTGISVYSRFDLSSALGMKDQLINILRNTRSPKTQVSFFNFG
jgi:uroporphyrinogen-III synthase